SRQALVDQKLITGDDAYHASINKARFESLKGKT
ncbi:MAG: hypothetical protein RLZZ200_1818, partial [Pseudomonadota bacterium]